MFPLESGIMYTGHPYNEVYRLERATHAMTMHTIHQRFTVYYTFMSLQMSLTGVGAPEITTFLRTRSYLG